MPINIKHLRDGEEIAYEWTKIHYVAFTTATQFESNPKTMSDLLEACSDLELTDVQNTDALAYMMRGIGPIPHIMEHDWKFSGGENNEIVIEIKKGDEIQVWRSNS